MLLRSDAPCTQPDARRGTGAASSLVLLAVIMASEGLARTAVGPVQEALQHGLRLSDNEIGIVQGPAMTLPLAVAAIPIGLVVARYPRGLTLFAFAGLTVAGTVLTAAATGFWTLLLARCLVGLSTSATAIAAMTTLADLYPAERRGRATMITTISEVLGVSGVFALGGMLLVGFGSGSNSWRPAMICIALVAMLGVASVPALRGIRHAGPSAGGNARRAWQGLWQCRATLLPLLVGKTMVGIAYGAVLTWAAPALLRGFSLGPDRVGATLATCLLISGIVGPLVGGLLADMCQRVAGPRRTMVIMALLALCGVPAGLFALAPNSGWAIALLLLFMSLMPMISVMEVTLSITTMPIDARGMCLSMMVAAGAVLGTGSAPLLVSFASGVSSSASAIGVGLAIVCALTGVISAIGFVIGSRFAQIAPLEAVT